MYKIDLCFMKKNSTFVHVEMYKENRGYYNTSEYIAPSFLNRLNSKFTVFQENHFKVNLFQ